MRQETEAEVRYQDLIDDLLGCPGVTPPPGGSAAAVAARVDSLEHGMWLDPSLLPQMAAQGTALTPTLFSIVDDLPKAPRHPRDRERTGTSAARACTPSSPSRQPRRA